MTTYKGKSTTRSWASLPAELLRLVITHLVFDISATAYIPHSWTRREDWQGRMVYVCIRDAAAIETVMRVAPAWAAAIEYSRFWEQAAATLDPNDCMLPLARQYRLSPYRHFRQNLYFGMCLPCRINQPSGRMIGIQQARKRVSTYHLGAVPVCKDHRRDRFCGVCLRDASLDENSIVENEERAVWPDVVATCKFCRTEKLFQTCSEGQKKASNGGRHWTYELEAAGGRTLTPCDWEARQAVDAFLEMGEGTIADVVTLCMEKLWLRTNTKIVELMRLAVATSRMQSRMAENAQAAGFESGGGGYVGMGEMLESEEELSDLDEEEDEDLELMSITEDSQGLRESAINNWARARILDGNWYSPADQWFLLHDQGQPNSRLYQPISLDPSDNPFPYCRAEHPIPWTLPPEEAVEPHPNPELAAAYPPPSFNLCSAVYEAFRREMSAILLPAMMNVVRKVVMECAVDGADATVRVSRMSVEDVVSALREGDTWFNGLDWIGRAHSRNQDKTLHKKSASESSGKEDATVDRDRDDSSSSSKSGSRTTSPVLSTATLDTTPSPPPSSDEKNSGGNTHNNRSGAERDSDERSERPVPTRVTTTATTTRPPMPPPMIVPSQSRLGTSHHSPVTRLPIPISPVLKSPTQIPSIPFIPVSMSEMPQHTIETFIAIWREACAPLFHCRCRICERAILGTNINLEAAGFIVPSQRYHEEPRHQRYTYTTPAIIQLPTAEAEIVEDTDDDMQLIDTDTDLETQQQGIPFISIVDDNDDKPTHLEGVEELSASTGGLESAVRTGSISRKRSSEAIIDDDDNDDISGLYECSEDDRASAAVHITGNALASATLDPTLTPTAYTKGESTRSQSPPKRQKIEIEPESITSSESEDIIGLDVQGSKIALPVIKSVGPGLGRSQSRKRWSEDLETLERSASRGADVGGGGGGGGGLATAEDDEKQRVLRAGTGTPKRARIDLAPPSLPSVGVLGTAASELNGKIGVGLVGTKNGAVNVGAERRAEEGMDV